MIPEYNNIPEALLQGLPLFSDSHEFKSTELYEAYKDAKDRGYLKKIGYGLIPELPKLQDEHLYAFHVFSKPRKIDSNNSGYYYLSKLLRNERKRLKNAFKSQNKVIPYRSWFESKFDSLTDFLESSIIWAESKEGYEYWEGIATKARYEDGNRTRITLEDLQFLSEKLKNNNL